MFDYFYAVRIFPQQGCWVILGRFFVLKLMRSSKFIFFVTIILVAVFVATSVILFLPVIPR